MFPAPPANRGLALDENIEVRLMICTTARAPTKWRLRPMPQRSLPATRIGVTFSLSGRPL